jgi:predicted ATP-dependent endonuclease of OLD family
MEFLTFHIVNYKGIKDSSFSLGVAGFSDICTLIGLNESGKTTILEAIHTFYSSFIPSKYLDDTPKEAEILDAYNFIPRSEISNFNGDCSISVDISYKRSDLQELINLASELDYIVQIPREKIMNISVNFSYKSSQFDEKTRIVAPKGILVKKRRAKKWTPIYDVKPLWLALEKCLITNLPEIIYYPDFAFNFPHRIYLEEYAGESIESRFYRNFIQDVLDSFDGDYKIEDHILVRVKDKSGQMTAALRQTIRKLEHGIRDLVFKSEFSVFETDNINIDLGVPLHDTDNNAYYIELKIDQDGEFYSVEERSRGFRWFFSFILLTQFRAHRILGKYPVFLIDEPASNLHPSAQTKLLKAFEDIGKYYRGSVVYSTHSHYLINPLWLENSYIVINESISYNDFIYSKDDSGGIKIYKYRTFVNDFPSKTDYFQPVLDVLQYTPSKLDKIPDSLIVEGKSDFFILKKISEQLGYDLNIIPALGSGAMEAILSLYMGWGKKYVTLFDDDEEGIKQIKRYIKLGVPASRVITFKNIDSSFSGYEIENFLDEEFFIGAKLDKSANKKDIANAVYRICSSGKKIPLSPKMTSNFVLIFDHIKSLL